MNFSEYNAITEKNNELQSYDSPNLFSFLCRQEFKQLFIQRVLPI